MISWHRFYDPTTGRYISADPIGLRGGMNLYAYALGNPVTLFDANGLKVEVRCRPIAGVDGPDNTSEWVARNVLNAKHCYVVVSCEKQNIPETTISYLGPSYSPVAVHRPGGTPNNDTRSSDAGEYQSMPVSPSSSNECCELEKCILKTANRLNRQGYTIPNYGLNGPNSNSFAHRLIHSCGGSHGGLPGGGAYGWQKEGDLIF